MRLGGEFEGGAAHAVLIDRDASGGERLQSGDIAGLIVDNWFG